MRFSLRDFNEPFRSELEAKLKADAAEKKAKGKKLERGMNGWESDYAAELELRRSAGEIIWDEFEAIKLRLAAKTHYTPDFAVLLADGSFELHEVKGFWREDARIKIKIAAEKFPFAFVAVTRRRKSAPWKFERF